MTKKQKIYRKLRKTMDAEDARYFTEYLMKNSNMFVPQSSFNKETANG